MVEKDASPCFWRKRDPPTHRRTGPRKEKKKIGDTRTHLKVIRVITSTASLSNSELIDLTKKLTEKSRESS